MQKNSTDLFYSNLPIFEEGLISRLSNPNEFVDVPNDWHVIITDVKGSTQAIQNGLHQQVNLTATATIISALNIAKKKNLTFPFFFGGDGATLLVPGSMKDELLSALSIYKRNVLRAFDLELRVDEVPVSSLYEKEQVIKISKVKLSSKYTVPIILGEGLIYADNLIKSRHVELEEESDESLLNLEGMECRWDAIKPSEKKNQVLCLLLRVMKSSDQARIFKEVFEIVEEIYGSFEERRPISIENLKLAAGLDRFDTENKLKFGSSSPKRIAKSIIGYVAGKVFLRRSSGKEYLKNLVELSDTLVLNGMMNTVISGTEVQRKKLDTKLQRLEEAGQIVYGMNVCNESIMSCYVQDRKDNHIHFIDGSEGGYTAAAIKMKRKLAAI